MILYNGQPIGGSAQVTLVGGGGADALVQTYTFLIKVPFATVVVGYTNAIPVMGFNRTPKAGEVFLAYCVSNDDVHFYITAQITNLVDDGKGGINAAFTVLDVTECKGGKVDQTFSATSTNAQSGVAINKALADVVSVAETYADGILEQAESYADGEITKAKQEAIQVAHQETVLRFTDAKNYTDNQIAKLSLGIHTDGLLYIFVDGVPVGDGFELPSGGDVVGYVDADKNIVLKGNLADGEYSFKYEMADGSTIDIGSLVVEPEEPEEPEEPDTPTPYDPDQIPLAINADGSPFEGTDENGNPTIGYKYGARLSLSTGDEKVDPTGAVSYVTGFIDLTKDGGVAKNRVLRIKNIPYDNTSLGIVGYDENFVKLSGNGSSLAGMFGNGYDDGNDVRRSEPLWYYTHFNSDALKYIRLCSSKIANDSILTIDQPISNGTNAYPNLLDTAYDTDLKTVYNGVGWKANVMVTTSGVEETISENTKTILTGLIAVENDGDVFHVRGVERVNYVAGSYSGYTSCYDSNGEFIQQLATSTIATYGTDENGDFTITLNNSSLSSGTAYIRFQFGSATIGTKVIMTRNQLITD